MSCNNLIQNSTIESIYHDGKHIKSNEIETTCISDSEKKAWIAIFDRDGNALLHPNRDKIERTYYREKQLFSKEGIGKVVEHEYFVLDDKYRGKKIAKKVHEKELEAYRLNDFDEIQLYAAWDGLIVWKKLYFNFTNKRDEDFVKIAIQHYLSEVKGYTNLEIKDIIKSNPFSISSNHLKSASGEDFKIWINKRYNKSIVLSMYKEVS